jgi:hypothetical protein
VRVVAAGSGHHRYSPIRRFEHQLDDAATFVVVPEGDERGFARLEGRWSGEEIAAAAELPVR